jgi:hypothetical protein
LSLCLDGKFPIWNFLLSVLHAVNKKYNISSKLHAALDGLYKVIEKLAQENNNKKNR